MLSISEKYKTQINLIDFVRINYGFKINRKKSSQRQYVLNNLDTKTTIIISRNLQGQYWYFNPNNSQDKGTIIDFVLHRNQQDQDGMWTELESFFANEKQSNDIIEPKTEKSIVEFQILPLTETVFLEKRGIRISTLFSEEFKNRIFNHIHKVGKVEFTNIAFPIYKNEEIIGLELKNAGFHGYALDSQKVEGIWVSNYSSHNPDQITEWVIAESAIDCLSFHQLFPPDEDIQRAYISTGGVITFGQKKEIQRLIALFPNSKIFLANDNDLFGIRQNIETMGYLTHSLKSERIKIQPKPISPQKLELQIHINSGNIDLNFEVESLAQVFQKDQILEIHHIDTQFKGRESALISLHLQTSLETLIRLEKMIPIIRGLKNWFEVKKPKNKDFNEDLMAG